MATTYDDTGSPKKESVVLSCCSCSGRSKKPVQKRRSTIWHDSRGDGHPEQVQSMVFFDAEEEELLDDEYPIMTTSYIPKDPCRVSMLEPETLLREQEPDDTALSKPELPPPSRRLTNKRQSTLRKIAGRRATMEAVRDLEKPRVPIIERGYPGQLNAEELAQCQKFYHEIKKHPVIMEIVYSLKDVEEEPYSICRFLRANKFDADRTLERLKGMLPGWEEAKAHDFYPDPGKYMGVPVPVVSKMYPFVYHGNAKNGSPVSYLKAGELDTEGLLSLTTVEQSSAYYWYQHLVSFQESMKRAQKRDPKFVRCENFCVIDLADLDGSNLTLEANETMKVSSKIADYFPETLHCLLVLNAPRWFDFAWKIIRSLLDPRTAKKIEVYSSKECGQSRLQELIDIDEVPSDFGGNGPSTDSILSRGRGSNKEAEATADQVHWSVQVTHVKPKSTKKLTNFVELARGEYLSMQIYTRSVCGVAVSVFLNDDVIETNVKVAGTSILSDTSLKNPPKPYSTDICQVKGPGIVSVQLEDLGDLKRARKKLPHGHFVVVGRIESIDQLARS